MEISPSQSLTTAMARDPVTHPVWFMVTLLAHIEPETKQCLACCDWMVGWSKYCTPCAAYYWQKWASLSIWALQHNIFGKEIAGNIWLSNCWLLMLRTKFVIPIVMLHKMQSSTRKSLKHSTKEASAEANCKLWTRNNKKDLSRDLNSCGQVLQFTRAVEGGADLQDKESELESELGDGGDRSTHPVSAEVETRGSEVLWLVQMRLNFDYHCLKDVSRYFCTMTN